MRMNVVRRIRIGGWLSWSWDDHNWWRGYQWSMTSIQYAWWSSVEKLIEIGILQVEGIAENLLWRLVDWTPQCGEIRTLITWLKSSCASWLKSICVSWNSHVPVEIQTRWWKSICAGGNLFSHESWAQQPLWGALGGWVGGSYTISMSTVHFLSFWEYVGSSTRFVRHHVWIVLEFGWTAADPRFGNKLRFNIVLAAFVVSLLCSRLSSTKQ